MRKVILTALLMAAASAQAQPISEEQAAQTAKLFFEARGYGGTEVRGYEDTNSGNPAPSRPRTAAPSMLQLAHHAPDAYYIYNKVGDGTKGSFVIVAADERMGAPILGWSDNGTFDPDNMPCGLRVLLSRYAEIPKGWDSSPCPTKGATPFTQRMPRKAEGGGVEPLIQTQWNQSEPYWNECPVNGSGTRAVTGCVIIAMAQLMSFWQWPQQGRGAHQNSDYKQQFRDFSLSTYEWENMVPNYETTDYTSEQADAVARLMADVGCAMNARYFGPLGTTAFSTDVPVALTKYFNYSRDAHNYGSWPGENDIWNPRLAIKTELEAGRPVLCGLMTLDGSGHEVVIDGYRPNDTDDYFHFNFGWGGLNDGWYFTGRGAGGHNGIYADEMTIGIHPSDYPAVEKDDVFFNIEEDGAVVMCAKDVEADGYLSIDIPSTVEYNGHTFDVTSIYDMAFRQSNIRDITFPGTIKKIPALLFIHSKDLRSGSHLWSVTFNEGLEEIGDQAFAWSRELSGLYTLPSTIKRIGDGAFSGCPLFGIETAAKDFTIGNSNFNVRQFRGLENAKEIGSGGVSGLEGTFTVQPTCLYHPHSVRSQKVFIPASADYQIDTVVPDFGYEVDADHPTLASRDSVLYNKDMTTLLRHPNNDTEYTVPEGVVTVDKDALINGYAYLYLPMSIKQLDGVISCEGRRYVAVPLMTPPTFAADASETDVENNSRSVLKVPIGSKAAYEQAPVWKNFASINEVLYIEGPLIYDLSDWYGELSDGYAQVVGRNTAYEYDGHVVIPETVSVGGRDYVVSSVNKGAFLYDESITSISLNSSVYELGMGGQALVTCPNIHSVSVAEGNEYFHAEGDMLMYDDWGNNVLSYCPPMKKEGDAIVPRTSVTIPGTVREIGWNVFHDNLHSVTIPANVDYMKPTAFKRCADLMEIHCLGDWPPRYDTTYQMYGHSFHDNVFLPEHGTVLYIPKGTYDIYDRCYEWWWLLHHVQEVDASATAIDPLTMKSEESTGGTDLGGVYDLQGRRIAADGSQQLPKGIYIVDGKKIIK